MRNPNAGCQRRARHKLRVFNEPSEWRRKRAREEHARAHAQIVPAKPASKSQAGARAYQWPISLCLMCGRIQVGFKTEWRIDLRGVVAQSIKAVGLRFNFSVCCPACTPEDYDAVVVFAQRSADLMRRFGNAPVATVLGSVGPKGTVIYW